MTARNRSRGGGSSPTRSTRAGGKIFAQLWHVGRFSHPVYQPGGAAPVAPSAIAPGRPEHAWRGRKRARDRRCRARCTTDELASIAGEFAHGAANAIEAGFDGVEIDGAGGYLIAQFLCDNANAGPMRTAARVANRMRFPLEVVDAVDRAPWAPDARRSGSARSAWSTAPSTATRRRSTVPFVERA